MLLKPGKHVKVRHKQSGDTAEASISDVTERELTLLLSPDLTLYPGDEIELELYQWEDALYLCQAVVKKVSENKVMVLLGKAGLRRLQRRKAERIPANVKAEYALLPKKDPGPFQKGLIQNISRNGVLLSVEEPLEIRSRLYLMFEIPLPRGKAFTTGISGNVVREHRGPAQTEHSYGVEFDKPLAFLAG